MRVYTSGSPANSPLDMICNAPALCSSTPPTESQSQLLIWAKWRSFPFEQSVKTGPPGIGEWVYFILRLVGWRGVSTMRAAGVCVSVDVCIQQGLRVEPHCWSLLVCFNIAAACLRVPHKPQRDTQVRGREREDLTRLRKRLRGDDNNKKDRMWQKEKWK